MFHCCNITADIWHMSTVAWKGFYMPGHNRKSSGSYQDPCFHWNQAAKSCKSNILQYELIISKSGHFYKSRGDDDVGWFCRSETKAPCSHWFDYKLLWVPKHSLQMHGPMLNEGLNVWLNDWKSKESRCCYGPVKVQPWALVKYCDGTLELCIKACLQASINRCNVIEKRGQNSSTMMWESDNIL